MASEIFKCPSFWSQSLRHAAFALQSVRQDVDTASEKPRFERRKRSLDRGGFARTPEPACHCAHLQSGAHHDSHLSPKKGEEARLSFADTLLPAVRGEALELDELVIRYRFKRRYKYLWLVVSRLTHQVLSWTVGDRSVATWRKLWFSVPAPHRRKLAYTDFYEVYAKGFSPWQHRPSPKGSGKTSVIEGFNNKWRNRVSGLVRKTVCVRYLEDLERRLWLVIHQHNLLQIKLLENYSA